MFNKKNDNGNGINQSSSGAGPLAPPQMRKPASIAPLPPKRKEIGMPTAETSQIQATVETPEYHENATFIGHDLKIIGSIISSGEVVIEGIVEGDVRAQKIIIKNGASINGELVSEELIIHGRVKGLVRGIRILLAADCVLEGDILHETLSIESGAEFEGSCKRSDNPLGDQKTKKATSKKSATIKPLAVAENRAPGKQEIVQEDAVAQD